MRRESFVGEAEPPGMRMAVAQARHRTVLPRAETGTESTLRQVRFGHMMRMLSSWFAISGPLHLFRVLSSSACAGACLSLRT